MERLVEAGHSLVPEPPPHLVEPPELIGPFEVRPGDPTCVNNARGAVPLRAAAEGHAAVLVRLLNAAYRHGTLGRLLPSDAGTATA